MSAASGFDEPGLNQNQTPAAIKMTNVVANVYLNIEADLPVTGAVFSLVFLFMDRVSPGLRLASKRFLYQLNSFSEQDQAEMLRFKKARPKRGEGRGICNQTFIKAG